MLKSCGIKLLEEIKVLKNYLRNKMLNEFLICFICLISISAGCATKSTAEKKYHIRTETGPEQVYQVYSEIKEIFDEGVLAFHQNNYQLAQLNLSEVIERERNLPTKKYTARAQEYLQQIEIIEPQAIPGRILSEEELAERKAEQEIRQKLNEKISLEFRDADIKEVLSGLSTSYGINIVCDKEVQGKVSVKLEDVTVEEALKAILDISGYRYERRGSIIYVENISKGKISKIFNLGYIDPSICQEVVSELLSAEGAVKVDETYNRLIVTDLPVNIEEVEKFIKNFDSRIPQVLIEVKIVDITVGDLAEMGIEWSTTYEDDYLFHSRNVDEEDEEVTESVTGTYTQRGPGTTSLPDTQFDVAVALKYFTDISFKIDALISKQKADLLANPKIITQNNQEARIVIGEKVPYKEKTQTTTGTTETTKFIDVGTTLRVTPKISADGYITMTIHPEVSSVTSFIDNQPRIDTREADTTVTVKDEQTIILGGLIKKSSSIIKRKVPILGDIPILGLLFQSRGKDIQKKELVVFITPHIIRYPDDIESAP